MSYFRLNGWQRIGILLSLIWLFGGAACGWEMVLGPIYSNILTKFRRLGHSKAANTLDVYGHLIEGADAAAAKAIEGILK